MRSTRFAAALLPLLAATGLALFGVHCGPSAPPATPAIAQPSQTATTTVATAVEPPASSSASASASSAEVKPAEPPHWGYHGEHGPLHWGDLSAEWATCKTGTSQAPIDIVAKDAAKAKELKPLELAYKPMPLAILDTGHGVQVNAAAGNTLAAAGDTWELTQFHLHTPSEHLVDGKRFDGELHLVHKNAKGAFAVVAVLLKKGKDSKSLAPLLDNLPKEPSKEPTTIEGKTIDVAPLVPKKALYYTYSGSLTTPPCTEGVTFFVLGPTAEISDKQIEAFKAATHGDTSRPIQPLGDRKVALFK